mmetsp:Transcript_43203/g.131548  ORF Transcript_43203/g.131548 Transcript_43203/m.131548 type:complete len:120 (-) Transcript_43203:564-923(-)
MGVLWEKHPTPRDLLVVFMKNCAPTPHFVPVNPAEYHMETVAHQLSGDDGPRGTDSEVLIHWPLKFGGESCCLRQFFSRWVDWLANSFLPWVAFLAFIVGPLVATEKCQGVCPARIGEA